MFPPYSYSLSSIYIYQPYPVFQGSCPFCKPYILPWLIQILCSLCDHLHFEHQYLHATSQYIDGCFQLQVNFLKIMLIISHFISRRTSIAHSYSLIYFISSLSFIITGTLSILSEDFRAEVYIISCQASDDVCPGLSAAAGECAPCLHDLPGPAGSQEAAEEETEAACSQGHQATRVSWDEL